MLRRDKMILESLTNKYGKHNILNELNTKTYFNAGRKAFVKGQYNRSERFHDAATMKFRKDNDIENFIITDSGFACYIGDNLISYDIDYDEMQMEDKLNPRSDYKVLSPFCQELRTEDRRLIRSILNYFKEFNPESVYNKKAIYIA
jgi:hypothetical protein